MSVIRELPAVRSDLIVLKKSRKIGSTIYIKDDISGEAYELGDEDYFIFKSLDGKTTMPSLMASFKERFGFNLNAEQLRAFLSHLYELELLDVDGKNQYASVFTRLRINFPTSWHRWVRHTRGITFKWLAGHMGWCYTKGFVFIAVMIFLLALGTLFNNFQRFLFDFNMLFAPLSIFQIILVMYFCLNIPSQIARAVTAEYYGGIVTEFGIQFGFDIIPLCYSECNIGLINDKAGRGWVIFAPAFYGLLTASLGMLCWIMTPGGLALHTFGLTVAVVGTVYSVFRLNFFWPVDASYLFANWLDIPEIRRRAISFTKSWLLHHSLSEPLTARERGIFTWYGPLSGGITLGTISVGFYYLGKWLVYYIGGIGALLLLIVVMLRYRKVLAEFI
jgi:hypothetical protein